MIKKIRLHIFRIFFVVIALMIAKESFFFKKEMLDVTIKLNQKYENINGHLFVSVPIGYKNQNSVYQLIQKDNSFNVKIPQKINLKYTVNFNKKINGNLIITNQKNEKIRRVVSGTSIIITEKELKSLYEISILKILIYLTIAIGLSIKFIEKNEIINKKNLGIFSLGMLFLSIAVNPSWVDKLNAVYISITILYFFKNIKKIKFNYYHISSLLILMFIFFSEYVGLKNFQQSYNQYERVFISIIFIGMWNYSKLEIEKIKNYLFLGVFFSSTIILYSPLPMNGIYCFTFGFTMMILSVFSFERLLISKYKLIYIVGILLSLNGIYESGRRTVMLSIMVYLSIYLFRIIKKSNLKTKLIIFIIIVSGISCLKIKNPIINKIKTRIISIVDLKNDQSNIQRILMWRKGYYIFKNNMFTGIGINNFYNESQKNEYDETKVLVEKFDNSFVHPHNEYLHHLIQKGLIGGIIYLFILINLIIQNIKYKDNEINGFIFTTLLYGIFEPYSIRVESLIVFIVLSMSINEKNEMKNLLNNNKIKSIVIIFLILVMMFFNKRFRYYFIQIVLINIILEKIKKRRTDGITK